MATLENTLSSDELSKDAQQVLAIYDDVDADKYILERRMLYPTYLQRLSLTAQMLR